MRIAAISDIHGNADALEAVLSDLDGEGVDGIVVLGDLVAFGPDPARVIDRLRGIGARVVRGNTDRYLLGAETPRSDHMWDLLAWGRDLLGAERIAYLESLPATMSIDLDGTSALLCHGTPGSDEVGFFPGEEQGFADKLAAAEETLVIAGHTHKPLWSRVGDKVIVNDGSVGFPYDGKPRPSWAIVETAGGEVTDVRIGRTRYDTGPVSRRLAEIGLPMADAMSERVRTGRMTKSFR